MPFLKSAKVQLHLSCDFAVTSNNLFLGTWLDPFLRLVLYFGSEFNAL